MPMKQNPDNVEQAILGCILIDDKLFPRIASQIESKHFAVPQHRVIWDLMKELYEQNRLIDVVTVCALASTKGLAKHLWWGRSYVSGLNETLLPISHIDTYIEMIIDAYKERELRRACNDIITGERKFEDSLAALNEMHEYIRDKRYEDLEGSVDMLAAEIFGKQGQEFELDGLSFTIEELDEHIGGLCKEHLIILGARPRTGKSAFSLQIAKQAAISGKKVLFLSCEMTINQLSRRLYNTYGVRRSWFNDNNLPQYKLDEILNVKEEIKKLDIKFIRCTEPLNQTLNLINAELNANKYDLVIVDYIQKIPMEDGHIDERTHIAKITGSLKNMAAKHKVPILGLAQVNREAVKRGGADSKRPRIEDLYGSSAIEADADVIVLMHAPHHYMDKGSDNYNERLTEFIVAKNREGEADQLINVDYNKEIQEFN
jgi:replicative DNA helicase